MTTHHYNNDTHTIQYTADNTTATIPNAENTSILGELIDKEGSTNTSLKYRLAQAEKCFWANFRNLRKPATAATKIKSWLNSSAISALYNSETWCINDTTLRQIRSWELQHLRKIIPFRQCDTISIYYKESARLIDQIRKTNELPHMTHILLDATFRSAYGQKTNKDEHGRNITDERRTFRNCNWFDTVKTTHSRKRKSGRNRAKNRSKSNRTRTNPQRNTG